MLRRFAIYLGTCLAMLLGAHAAAADDSPVCSERTSVLQQLSAQYKEAPVAMGLANNGGMIELLRSRDRATWTLILTMPDGMTCLIAAGQSWERVPVVAQGPKI